MHYFRYIYSILFICGLILLFPACKSTKSIISSDGTTVSKSQNQLIDDILSSEMKYKTISGKISLEFIAGNKTSGMKGNARLKIIRDNIVQLSILAPFINSEMFRINITPDSVFIIDRISKRYAVEDIRKLEKSKNIQFNYNNMQSLFTNALFVPGQKQVSKGDYNSFTITQNSKNYQLLTKDKSGIIYNFTVDPNDRIVETNISGSKSNNYKMQWTYDSFVKENGYIYPTKMISKINIDKRQVTLVMNHSGLDIDKELNVDRNLPTKYEKVSVIEILRKYIK